MLLTIVLQSTVLFLTAHSIPVDNGVEGEPEIECGSTAITVNFNTRNTFEGHVYVKVGLQDSIMRKHLFIKLDAKCPQIPFAKALKQLMAYTTIQETQLTL
ncbi:hypothetical protein TELCIR_24116, partial [Teladorsagia circumcincta]